MRVSRGARGLGWGPVAAGSKWPLPLSDDTAPSASLDHLEPQAAPRHLRALPEHLGSLPWPQELASRRPKVEDSHFQPAAVGGSWAECWGGGSCDVL